MKMLGWFAGKTGRIETTASIIEGQIDGKTLIMCSACLHERSSY